MASANQLKPQSHLLDFISATSGKPRIQVAREVLIRCMPLRLWILANLMLLIDADFFAQDLNLIYALNDCNDLDEFEGEILEFRRSVRSKGLLGRKRCLRVSTTRLMDLGRMFYGKSDERERLLELGSIRW